MNISLSREDHEMMRERIVAYMEYLPLTHNTAPVTEVVRSIDLWRLFRSRHLIGALAVALMVTTTTYSVTSAATDALPGDLLWPVKVHVNEGVKTVFVSGDEARVAWERERMELRLEEASSLAAQGRLDAERQDAVSKQFVMQAEAAVEKVREIEERDPILAAEASAELADTLDTHKAVLARMVVEHEVEGLVEEDARTFVKEVHRLASDAEALRDETEKKLSLVDEEGVASGGVAALVDESGPIAPSDAGVDSTVSSAADTSEVIGATQENKSRATHRARARAETLRARAETLIEARSHDEKVVAPARAHVATATVLMNEGNASLAGGDLSRAYGEFRNAASILHKTIALLRVAETYASELTEGMLEEDPVVSETPAQVSPEESQVLQVSTSTEVRDVEEPATSVTREDVVRRIEEVKGMLVARHVDGADGSGADAHRHLKDAMANMLRADIALSLEHRTEAMALFMQAYERANAARDLLRNEDVGPARPHDPEMSSGEIKSVIATPTLSVARSIIDSVHVYEGVLPDVSCASVKAELIMVEVPNTVLSLELTTIPFADGEVCDGRVASYRATTSVPAAIDLTSVFLNGSEVTWSFSEAPIEERSAANPRGLLQRTLEGAQKMLRVE